jgi:hypothetical protein
MPSAGTSPPESCDTASGGRERGGRRYSVRNFFGGADIAKKVAAKQAAKRSKTQPVLGGVDEEENEEKEKEDVEYAKRRSVMVRSVYSSARRSLAKRSVTMGSLPEKEQQSAPGNASLPGLSEADLQGKSPGRLTLKLAAAAVQKGARETILGRSMVKTFVTNMLENHAEQQGLITEVEKIEKEREEEEDRWRRNGMRKVNDFHGKAAFLTSLLDEMQQFRSSGQTNDESSKLMAEIMANLQELQIKMNALKGMYAMDRRNCVALNAAIDLCVKDVQTRFAHIGENMKKLKDTTEVLGEDVAHELEKISSESVEAALAAKRITVTFADSEQAAVLAEKLALASVEGAEGATDDGEDPKAATSSFQVGEHVLRRDRGLQWGHGYVTTTDPLRVNGRQAWSERFHVS